MSVRARVCGLGSTWCLLLITNAASATLIVNPPIPVTHETKVQLVRVFDDDGMNGAITFDDGPDGRADIELAVDEIWAQVGIDVTFLAGAASLHSTLVLGNPREPDPDPFSYGDDFDIAVDAVTESGVLRSDARVMSIIFVEALPEGFAAGEGGIGTGLLVGSGWFFMTVSPGYLSREDQGESVAHFASRAMALAMGLKPGIYDDLPGNLLEWPFSNPRGLRLNEEQGVLLRASPFAVLIPEPATFWLLGVGLAGAIAVRRSRRVGSL